MTKNVFFDTDGISTFMWIKKVNIIEELFGGNIVFPKEVYDELSNPVTPHLKAGADALIQKGMAIVEPIEYGSTAFYVYRMISQDTDGPMIGKGEAAAIALAYTNGGIMASNNMRDIDRYIKKYKLVNLTTIDILKLAEEKEIICELEAESIWREMKSHGRKLPEGTYKDNK